MQRGVFSSITEALGRGVGGLLAPLVTEITLIRAARLTHAYGVVYTAEVCALPTEGALAALGKRLEGRALVRLAGALRRPTAKRDALGFAVRFKGDRPIAEAVEPSDQDLLLGSFQSLLTLPFVMLSTRAGDFLANTYYGGQPYRIEGFGRAELRLVPLGAPSTRGNRNERLALAVAEGRAIFRLDVRKKSRRAAWVPVASIDLRERACVDQDKLTMNPFHAARGIHPAGFVHALRAAVYPASQLGRNLAAGKLDVPPAEAVSSRPVTEQQPTLASCHANCARAQGSGSE